MVTSGYLLGDRRSLDDLFPTRVEKLLLSGLYPAKAFIKGGGRANRVTLAVMVSIYF
jgi:hypothetical protein